MAVGTIKKIKVLFIVRWYPDKADPQLGIFIKKHAQAVALYADVAVIYISTFNPKYQVTDFYISEEKNVRQFFLYYPNSAFKIINAIRYFLLVNKGWKVVLKNFGRPAIIHAHVLERPWIASYILGKLHQVPFLITEHWTGFTDNKFRKKQRWYKWIAKFIARRADGFTVVSQSLKQALINQGFTNTIEIVPNVVDVPKDQTRTASAKIMILTVADLDDDLKNISTTIKVISKIALIRKDFEFHIVGGGPDESKLVELARESGTLNAVIFFHGRKSNSEVYEFLYNSDFLIVNSNYETFSVVTAEALACGKPVIATISGGPEEIITGKTGILIDKGSQIALEEAVIKMLANYKFYDISELRASVTSMFSREKTGSDFIKLYHDILSSRKNGK